MKITQFEVIDSTNSYIKRNYEKLDHFEVISTNHQTEGKGRLGRIWLDDGDSLLFSILIKNDIKMENISQLPLVVAMVIHETLLSYIPDLLIKWPNDLVVHDKKLCGILIESISSHQEIHAVVVGIGINLSTQLFPESIKETATSFFLETNQSISSSLLIEEITSKLKIELEYLNQNKSQFVSYSKKYSFLLGKKISFIKDSKIMHGIAQDIKANGNLLVKTSHEVIEISTGEVHLLK